PDMGGSFGLRATIFPELVLVLWASKNLGRPVKWLGDRSEGFMGDDHGRDSHYRVALGLDKAGHFLALDIENVSALGAYVGLFGPFPSFGNMGGVAGTYVTPAISAKIWGVLTNTTPTAPYRGAGRPEATMAIELAIDRAAREMGIDRVELRRLNLISPDAMPYQTPLTYCYDCGDFEKNMAMAMELGDWSGFAQRQAQSRKRGALRGIGFVNAIEQSAGLFDEGAEISIDSHGVATVLMGTHSHGQGHETVFRQLLSERLGLDFEAIRYVQGDTDRVPYGHGTGGSRVSGLGGAALAKAAELLVDKGRAIAATTLESAVADIEFTDGRYNVAGTDLSVTLQEIARIANSPVERPADAEPGFRAFGFFKPAGPTYPNGCHICEVEIEIETGVLRLDRYCVADDVGTVLNPLLLHGQVHGGIVQGASQIMMEQIVFDPESGQLLTGSFMDYCMPRADDMPNIEVAFHEVPTPTNPLGVKGAGECGTVGALACVMSATLNALESVGITEIDMPATSERLWQALRDAGVSA
ncbi:MAG: molybdopterin-dependent oxidoreductase, partial [Gammaproteobacteria bacterium]|nr:molybdopterin-dependent oxidoreductase [Gammaproteobacteria bacterium]